jgi:hypothetical protein
MKDYGFQRLLQKNNTNLLVKRTIPIYYGGGYIFQNIGEMKNEGLELSLEAIPVKLDYFYWTPGWAYLQTAK